MTRVGWLTDESAVVGGAELTQAEFRAAAPDDVEIIDCPAGDVRSGCDVYVVHNCVTYKPEDMARIDGPVVKYHHDVGPHVRPGVRDFLVEHARHVCCSPVQRDFMGVDAALIPPPVDLDRFDRAAAEVNGSRSGSVSVGSWRNYGKAPHKVVEWSREHGTTVDFFGEGPYAPHGTQPVPYDAMPALLAQYERFVFLPVVLEPFGRLVVEAWASGCECVVNGLVGARYWIEEDPEAIETAAEDFWQMVLT